MFCDRRLANYERWFLEPPEDADMRVHPAVKKSVVFLCRPEGSGWKPTATAFVADHPSEFGAPDLSRAQYLVTAKHCLRGDLSGRKIRINTRSGTARLLDLPKKWWHHPSDMSTDVAVTPLPPIFGEATDLEPVPTETFIHGQVLGELIGEGDEVFMTGLFTPKHGDARNLPIVRTGNVALLATPGEPIPTKHGNIEAHLIEARSIRGLSGSPVFTRRTVMWEVPNEKHPEHGPLRLIAYGPEIALFGLMHGHWDVTPKEIKLVRADVDGENDAVNVGIAMVVPAIKILETLNHPEVVEMRKREHEKRTSGLVAVLDSVGDYAEQTTPKGATIPTPRRGAFMADLQNATQKKATQTRRSKPS